MLFLKLQDQLDVRNPFRDTVFDCLGGTEKIRCLGGISRPNTVFFEVLARIFALKQNLHRCGNDFSHSLELQSILMHANTTNCGSYWVRIE